MRRPCGRCETTFSMLSPDKKIGFKPFSPYFQEMIMWGRNNRGYNRGNHKSHKGTTRTTLLTPITMEKILFLLFPCCSILSSFLFTTSSSTTRCGCAYGQLLPHAPLHAGATSPPELGRSHSGRPTATRVPVRLDARLRRQRRQNW